MSPFQSQTAKDVHFYFFDGTANPDIEKLNALKAPSERWALGENVLYLFAPEGVARSKLATGVEKALGVPTTARNLSSVRKICALF